ncbi:IS481 family transposase [Brevibacterium jeotgali]|uniref:Transposase n=1 Tax=Brevibacterium jeotgali TaxID=1262550 RepID=A0A2H1L2M5_9MICO|nr:IS481 family transposase [Brevibacterium jeotgali]TWC02348.1 transposase [Brevibacterium jeotgali]SMY11142.1 Transposase [Brevibacterium jeotgali]
MTHANAPLTPAGRQRLVDRVLDYGRPLSHVAAEAGIARATLTKWVARYHADGPDALEDRSSAPARRPHRLALEAIELIDRWRRDYKWSARRITLELVEQGHHCCVRTVSRWLKRLGIARRRDLDPTGENNRQPGRITARFPGHMIHLDVKKVGKIPDGGGWWAHGRGSKPALASKRAHKQKVGYTYLHSAIDDFSRLAYTESLEDETAATTVGFFARARAYFAVHGITRCVRVVTDNGTNYRAAAFARSAKSLASRHQRTRAYTPRHNGKVERYQRLLTEECLYARVYASEQARRNAIGVWVHHYNYHRPHTACADLPPASRVHDRVDNVVTSYT